MVSKGKPALSQMPMGIVGTSRIVGRWVPKLWMERSLGALCLFYSKLTAVGVAEEEAIQVGRQIAPLVHTKMALGLFEH